MTEMARNGVPEFDYIDARFDEELLCSLCMQPFVDPVTCPSCRHCFCRAHTPTLASCPLCRRNWAASSLIPAPRMVLNILDRLCVRCPNAHCDRGRGGLPLTRGELAAHLQQCPVHCSFACGALVAPRDAAAHSVVCPLKVVACAAADVGCPHSAPRQNLADHERLCDFLKDRRITLLQRDFEQRFALQADLHQTQIRMLEQRFEEKLSLLCDSNGRVGPGLHVATGTFLDPRGLDNKGYSWNRYDRHGIREGSNVPIAIPRRGMQFMGVQFMQAPSYIRKTIGIPFDRLGPDGRDRDGFDQDGFDRNGFNHEGMHKDTGSPFDRSGFNREGINQITGTPFDNGGFDRNRLDRNGFDQNGFNREGTHKDTGTPYGPNGFDRNSFNPQGFFPHAGTATSLFDNRGFNRDGIHKDTGTPYDPAGFDRKYLDRNGFNGGDGYHLHSETRTPWDTHGFNIRGVHRETGTFRNRHGLCRDDLARAATSP